MLRKLANAARTTLIGLVFLVPFTALLIGGVWLMVATVYGWLIPASALFLGVAYGCGRVVQAHNRDSQLLSDRRSPYY